MDSQPHKIAADIYALKRIGISDWQDNFFWPVSEARYLELSEFLWSQFFEAYDRVDQVERALLLSDSAFIGFLTMHLHALAVQHFCQENGITLQGGPLSEAYYNPDWETLATTYRHIQKSGTETIRIRQWSKNARFNMRLNLVEWMKGVRNPDALALGSMSPLKRDYIRKYRLYAHNSYWELFLKGCDSSDAVAPPEKVRTILTPFLQAADKFLQREYSVRCDLDALVGCWARRLVDLSAVYHYVTRRDDLPDTLLLTEVAKPLNKIIAHAFRAKGKRVVGFHHGSTMGELTDSSFGQNEASGCDVFVCPTSRCARSFEHLYSLSRISHYQGVNFDSTETTYYQDLLERLQGQPFPEKIRSIMVMGFPMNAYRYTGIPGYFFLPQLDLELRLIRLLKDYGFKVLYKIHPERKEEAFDIFQPLCDQIVTDPFEKVWHRADALIFKYVGSSTFGFALCTNRPIFLLDVEKDYWQREHYALASKRCETIPAWISAENRIEFAEDVLIEKLSSKPHYPDFSYVKEFMFPEAISAKGASSRLRKHRA